MLLAPADGRSLAALGELLGFPKEELPAEHAKDQMHRFMEAEPELFQTYALRDAEITARYIRRVEEECSGLGLNNYRPVTVQKGEKELASEYIEVTTTVSAADMIIKGKFAHYTGEALKREEVSSIRVNPKEDEAEQE
jgi:hypothetical protein